MKELLPLAGFLKLFCDFVNATKDSLFSLNILQPLDIILSQDHNQVTALLEYVRYDFQPQIQLCSIRIMSILRYPPVSF